jgi:hypothetical protein
MTYTPADLIETIDVRQMDNAHLGVLGVMFPGFAEEIELGRYVRRLLSRGGYHAPPAASRRQRTGLAPSVRRVRFEGA